MTTKVEQEIRDLAACEWYQQVFGPVTAEEMIERELKQEQEIAEYVAWRAEERRKMGPERCARLDAYDADFRNSRPSCDSMPPI